MRVYMLYGEWTPGAVVFRAPEKGVRWRTQMIAARRLLRRLYYADTRRHFDFWIDGDGGGLWERAEAAGFPRYEWHEGDWREVTT